MLTGRVDVYPDVHLLVLLLVVDPPGQGSEGKVKADHSVLLSRHWQLHLPAVLLTITENLDFRFCNRGFGWLFRASLNYDHMSPLIEHCALHCAIGWTAQSI